jgi:hypothetical protein
VISLGVKSLFLWRSIGKAMLARVREFPGLANFLGLDIMRRGRALGWDLDWFFYLGYCTSNESPILEHITPYIIVVVLELYSGHL